MAGKLIQATYGTIEVIGYERPYRIERYTPNDGRPAVIERRFSAGPDDTSGPRSVYPSGYDSRCSCCYLGFSHTEAAHEKSSGNNLADSARIG